MSNLVLTLLIFVPLVYLFLHKATKTENTAMLMSILAYLVRAYFFTYSVIVVVGFVLPVAVIVYLLLSPETFSGYFLNLALIAGYILLAVYILLPAVTRLHNRINGIRSEENPNLFRHYDAENKADRLNRITDQFIAWIGTVKYFTSPFSLVSDPKSYLLKGDDMRQLIETGEHPTLQPGDILLRGYRGYIDGVMISLTGDKADLGKYFSHAALYIGDVCDTKYQSSLARRLKIRQPDDCWKDATIDEQIEVLDEKNGYFKPGKQMVIHAMTKGVFVEDILTFARCDYLVVLRLQENDIKLGDSLLTAIDENSDLSEMRRRYNEHFMQGHDSGKLEEQLMNNETLRKDSIIDIIIHSALGKIGSCYDFQFTDIEKAHTFSCSEFVYYCYRGLRQYLGLYPEKKALFNCFFPRSTITPEDFFKLSRQTDKLSVVWESQSIKMKKQSHE